MAVTMVIRNLPDNVDEATLRERLAEVLRVSDMELIPDNGTSMTSRQAIVKVDMPRFEAEELAQRWTGRIVGGRPLAVSAGLFME